MSAKIATKRKAVIPQQSRGKIGHAKTENIIDKLSRWRRSGSLPGSVSVDEYLNKARGHSDR